MIIKKHTHIGGSVCTGRFQTRYCRYWFIFIAGCSTVSWTLPRQNRNSSTSEDIYFTKNISWHQMPQNSSVSIRSPLTRSFRELKQRRFWATHVNRKWGLLPFYMPGHYQICIAEFLFSYKDDLPKGFNQTTAQCCKKSTSGWRPSLKNAVA